MLRSMAIFYQYMPGYWTMNHAEDFAQAHCVSRSFIPANLEPTLANHTNHATESTAVHGDGMNRIT